MNPIRTTLAVSQLERRDVPTAFAMGDGWTDPANLTLSFAPDGTVIGQPASKLPTAATTAAVLAGLFGMGDQYALLAEHLAKLSGTGDSLTADSNSRSDASAEFSGISNWQREVLRAFQTWASVTNLNIGLVADSGATLGASGAFQGDTRFGDIRVGGTTLDPSALANAMIVSAGNGTWAGDVLFNTAADYLSKYDVYTVALHEAGHVLGLAHSTDPTSAMSEGYVGPRTGLSASDVAVVRSYYGGARRPDGFDQAAANESRGTATPVTAKGDFTLTADRTTATDTDWYTFTLPANGTFTARLKTSGLSLLTARLRVVDDAGNVVGSAKATDPTRGDLTVTVNGGAGKYFLRVDSTATDAFGIGRYQLSVSGLGGVAVSIAPPQFGTADPATPTTEQPVLAAGTLTKSAYKSEVSVTMSSSGLFTLSSEATADVSGASLIVEVYDASGNKVLSFSQSANGSGSGSAYLQAGKYTVRTTAIIPLMSPGGKVTFTLRGGVESDPMGTAKPGTTTSPYPSSGSSSGGTTQPTTSQPTNSNTASQPYSY